MLLTTTENIPGRQYEILGVVKGNMVQTKNIAREQRNAYPNGLICLKGGELQHEVMPFKHRMEQCDLSTWFEEEYFQTKKVVFVSIDR